MSIIHLQCLRTKTIEVVDGHKSLVCISVYPDMSHDWC